MDEQQRADLQELVLTAMRERSLSATALAIEAGVLQATMLRMTKALKVRADSEKKVRDYLAGLAQTTPRERYSLVIEVTQENVGMIMTQMSPAEQKATAVRVLAALFNNEG